MIRLVVCFLTLAGTAIAQTSPDDLPGLDYDVPDFSINVDLNITGLVDAADIVTVYCRVGPTDSPEPVSGSGLLVLYRETTPELAPQTRSEPFEGSSIQKTVTVPIWANFDEVTALEHWRSGDCSLRIGPDPAREIEHSYTPTIGQPRICDHSQPGRDLFAVNCVWPGTDPNGGTISFTRAGLNSSAGDDAN